MVFPNTLVNFPRKHQQNCCLLVRRIDIAKDLANRRTAGPMTSYIQQLRTTIPV
jgi:hypothetical protein